MIRRSTLEMIPETRTSPSVRSPLSSCAIVVSRLRASSGSAPSSGWLETYSPSISRSKPSFTFCDHSGVPGTSKPTEAGEAPGSSSNMPNRLSCPIDSCFLTSSTESTARSCTSTRARRVCPRVSKAPALTSDSIARLLQTAISTLSMKSGKDSNRPLASRERTIEATTFSPTLRIAPRPNRTSSPTALKSSTLSFTSGDRTLIPSLRHSPR